MTKRDTVSVTPVLYTLQQVADMTQRSKNFIRARVDLGEIGVVYAGRTPMVTPEELLRWRDSLPTEKPDAA